jgi:paraquat-inducible protein B
MKRRAQPAVVGAFVIGGIVLFIAGIIIFGGGRFFRKTYDFVVYIPGSVSGLSSGSPVKFKGVEIGWVKSIHVDLYGATSRPDDIRVPVVISIDAEKLRSHGEPVNLGNAHVFGEYVQRGLRAQIGTSSFVTGLRYVSLDFFPGTKAEIVEDSDVPYQQIPYQPGQLDDAQKKLIDLLDRLSKLDYEQLLASLNHAVKGVEHTIEGIDKLTNAPELMEAVKALRDAAVNLNEAVIDLRKLEGTMGAEGVKASKALAAASESAAVAAKNAANLVATVSGMVHPMSPFLTQVGEALGELSAAARSVRRFMDQLDRDPAAVLRGRGK